MRTFMWVPSHECSKGFTSCENPCSQQIVLMDVQRERLKGELYKLSRGIGGFPFNSFQRMHTESPVEIIAYANAYLKLLRSNYSSGLKHASKFVHADFIRGTSCLCIICVCAEKRVCGFFPL